MAKAPKKTVTKAAPKPAKKAARPLRSDDVTLRHIGNALSEAHSLPKKQANTILEDMVTLITKHLKKGDRIRIGGLGILRFASVRHVSAATGYGRADQDQGQQEGCLPRCKDLKEQI